MHLAFALVQRPLRFVLCVDGLCELIAGLPAIPWSSESTTMLCGF